MEAEISLQDFFERKSSKEHVTVDVRSPKEFQEATIPGSINIPIFNNRERAEVGTIYKKVGKTAAKQKGLEIFSAKLPQFISAFDHLPENKTIFCWRGGMRSKTAVTVLDLMGIHSKRLHGGYRSYRQWVVQYLAEVDFKPELYVLNGFTGTGKTEILKMLKAEGYPVIDLEAMAGHRGSIFGQIGQTPHKQKKFDGLLYEALERYQDKTFVFIEGESKRIGRAMMPDIFYDKKLKGRQFYISMPIAERVKNILATYHPASHHQQIMEAFSLIKKRMPQDIAKSVEKNLMAKHYEPAVKDLLVHYYDPRYQHSNRYVEETDYIYIVSETAADALLQIKQNI